MTPRSMITAITFLLVALPTRAGMRRAAPVAAVLLSVSLVVMIASPTSAYEEAVKEPDLTDYVSMYENTLKDILENEKSIKEYKKELEDKSKSPDEISSVKKKIGDKTLVNQMLWGNADEIERLNIESYRLDQRTQKIFDEAEDTIRDHFFGINGVYDIFPDSKHRKIIVIVDPDDFANSDYESGINSFIDEIQKSVEVDVKVHVAKSILTHSPGCPSSTSPCQPGRGGIQISHQNTVGGGSTLAFKAQHPTHGTGFVIAGHEAVSLNNNIVQPTNGGVIGIVKVINSYSCDCAFVKSTSGHTMHDEIWASHIGSIYPVATRNVEPLPAGTIIMNAVVDGAGNPTKIGDIVIEGNNLGRINLLVEGGDSGSAVFKPRSDGKADIYGMIIQSRSTYALYTPYDFIKLKLGLSW